MRNLRLTFATLCILFSLCSLAWPQSQDTSAKASTAASAPATPPSAAEIAAAKSAGKVWVNLDSGVYHKAGRWYGKTKHGKFMTEDEARKAGYKTSQKE